MKRIFRNLKKAFVRSWRTFIGDMRDFGIHLASAYQEITLVVFFLIFGFASGLWLAAMVSGFLLFGYLIFTDFQPPKYKTAAVILLLGTGLALVPPQEKSPAQQPAIESAADTIPTEHPEIVFP